ncbi:MAG: hypothetical protein ABEH78_02145 [Haloferacaceae archaeon]
MEKVRVITKDDGSTAFKCPNCGSRVTLDSSRECWRCETTYEVYAEVEVED